MRRNKLIIRLTGIIMAIAGAVMIIHAVPVYVWYALLIILVLIFLFLLLNG